MDAGRVALRERLASVMSGMACDDGDNGEASGTCEARHPGTPNLWCRSCRMRVAAEMLLDEPDAGRVEASEEPPREGEGSGRYMQRLLLAGVPGDECARRVLAHYPGRKTKRTDAYYNWKRLKDSGQYPELPPWRPR